MNWLQTDNARRYAALRHLPLLVPPGGARQRGAGLKPRPGAAGTLAQGKDSGRCRSLKYDRSMIFFEDIYCLKSAA